MRYNEAVNSLNAYTGTISGRSFAGWVGVSQAEYYEVPESEEETPRVEF
ncbi:TPA: hypothetical protein DCX15_06175 [bacterium]|nr:hypothetical protein [bacterium]